MHTGTYDRAVVAAQTSHVGCAKRSPWWWMELFAPVRGSCLKNHTSLNFRCSTLFCAAVARSLICRHWKVWARARVDGHPSHRDAWFAQLVGSLALPLFVNWALGGNKTKKEIALHKHTGDPTALEEQILHNTFVDNYYVFLFLDLSLKAIITSITKQLSFNLSMGLFPAGIIP